MPKNPISVAISLLLLASLSVVASNSHAQSIQSNPSSDIEAGLSDLQITVVQSTASPSNSDATKSSPQWLSMYNTYGRWPGATIQWYFNPANVPTGLNADQVLSILQKATAKWEGMCGFKFHYMGTTSQGIDIRPTPITNDGKNVWGFDAFEAALAKFAGYAPTQIITYQDGKAVILQGDIKFNKDQYWTPEILEATATHEIGHAIGIGHSDNPQSVMSATPYHAADYMKVLRGDDAVACTALYGEAPTQWTNRILNWAESVYPSILKSTAEVTQVGEGYTYRYYPKANAYAGSKDGRSYFMGADRRLQDLGILRTFTQATIAAGF